MTVDTKPDKPTPPTEGPYVELNAFLKLNGLAATGGQAKLLIRGGSVLVNGVVETRNRKKLRVGDKVKVDDKTYLVEQSHIKTVK